MKAKYLRFAKLVTESVNNRLSEETPEREEEMLFSWIMVVLHYNIYNEQPKSKYQVMIKEKSNYKFKKVVLDEGCFARYVSSCSREEFMPILEKVIAEINELQAVNGYKFNAASTGTKERIKITVEMDKI